MSRYTVARKARLRRMRERAQASNEGPIDWLEPDPSAVEIMERVDSLPKVWRLLIYEFGYLITTAHYDDQYSPDDAFVSMAMRQENKQLEYATPFTSGRIRTLGRR